MLIIFLLIDLLMNRLIQRDFLGIIKTLKKLFDTELFIIKAWDHNVKMKMWKFTSKSESNQLAKYHGGVEGPEATKLLCSLPL